MGAWARHVGSNLLPERADEARRIVLVTVMCVDTAGFECALEAATSADASRHLEAEAVVNEARDPSVPIPSNAHGAILDPALEVIPDAQVRALEHVAQGAVDARQSLARLVHLVARDAWRLGQRAQFEVTLGAKQTRIVIGHCRGKENEKGT